MSNWNTDFMVGDRVSVRIAHTVRDPRTHRIVVKHSQTPGTVHTIDFDSSDIGVRFDDGGDIREVHNFNVHKI